MKPGRRRLWHIGAFVWAGALAAVSLAPLPESNLITQIGRHVVAFAGLTFLLRRFPALRWQAASSSWIYGALIEVAQAYVPYRSAGLADVLVNTVGVAVGLIVDRGVEVLA